VICFKCYLTICYWNTACSKNC